jgi:preprotein translocase subunit SecF
MRLKLVPDVTSIPFMRIRKLTVSASVLGVIASIALFLMIGLNYGIDFRGGTMLMTETPQSVDVGAYRDVLGGLGVGDVSVTSISDPAAEITGAAQNGVMIRVEQQGDDPAVQNDVIVKVKDALTAAFPGIKFLATESVGAKVSGELVQTGILSVLLAVFAVLVYIWLRFEWQFGVAAVIALVHDVTLTIGVFALVGLEFNLSIIAALLTIVGYSLNDTVVVFDRVRENLRKFKKMDLEELLNLTVNETLSRTTMTSFTTLVALVGLYVLGGEVIRGFTFAMIWGIVVGTYSSIFVAAVILLRLGVKRDWSKEAADAAAGVQFGSTGK